MQSGSEKQRAENEKKKLNPQQADAKKEPKGNQKVPNDRRRLGKLPPSSQASLAEKLKLLERWGVLPRRIVEEMQSSTGKEYPPEYREIISRYYERLTRMYDEMNGRD